MYLLGKLYELREYSFFHINCYNLNRLIYRFLSNDDEKKKVAGIQIYGLVLANHIQNYEFPNDVTAKQ